MDAASGPRRKLRAFCEAYREQIGANAGALCKLPDRVRADAALIGPYVQKLGEAAEYLAAECNAPELWNKLCGTPDDNPMLMWDRWYEGLPERMAALEYDEL